MRKHSTYWQLWVPLTRDWESLPSLRVTLFDHSPVYAYKDDQIHEFPSGPILYRFGESRPDRGKLTITSTDSAILNTLQQDIRKTRFTIRDSLNAPIAIISDISSRLLHASDPSIALAVHFTNKIEMWTCLGDRERRNGLIIYRTDDMKLVAYLSVTKDRLAVNDPSEDDIPVVLLVCKVYFDIVTSSSLVSSVAQ
ncbi:hypothetical protein HDU91_000608 [Kappamyces sp. JEL0680]|nr:hypothetical protein HDU91_000608 [Kappamyces sp. JEL0680]